MFFDYKKNRAWAENAHIVMQIGLTMAGCIAFCFFVGRWIDKLLATKGIFTVIFILLGVLGGANVVYRQIMETLKEDSTQSKTAEGGRHNDKDNGNH